ncbi:MAG: SAM-dependent methyltransferase [Ruminococcaceae bacterium]|nr:SAM-dependent methyltransferase [Oscillospiraceae bacterium]
MEINLSPRLLLCSQFVKSGERVADVGCDHGYLGIYLLKTNIAFFVFASDINPGPLSSAVRNAEKHGVAEHISFHLSAGVRDVPREFDTMICAGMGADTMLSILEDAPWLRNDRYRLILQCQSKTPLLRSYLWANGWDIRQEKAVKDGRFVYTVMEVVRGDYTPINAGESYFSPALSADKSAEAKEYLKRTVRMLRLSVEGKGENADLTEIEALQKLEELL